MMTAYVAVGLPARMPPSAWSKSPFSSKGAEDIFLSALSSLKVKGEDAASLSFGGSFGFLSIAIVGAKPTMFAPRMRVKNRTTGGDHRPKRNFHDSCADEAAQFFRNLEHGSKRVKKSNSEQNPISSVSSPAEKPENIACPFLPLPSSVFSQNSLRSTCPNQINATPFCSLTSILANHENFYGWKVDASGHDEALDLTLAIRLFQRPTTGEAFADLKRKLLQALLNRLNELSEMKPTDEVGLEIADSVYLLMLLGYSTSNFNIAGKKASRGAMMLREGKRLLMEGQSRLRSAPSDA